MEDNTDNYLNYKNLNKSIAKSTTFPGFCPSHDSNIFELIDNKCGEDTDLHGFLHSYRAVAKEYRSCQFNTFIFNEIIKGGINIKVKNKRLRYSVQQSINNIVKTLLINMKRDNTFVKFEDDLDYVFRKFNDYVSDYKVSTDILRIDNKNFIVVNRSNKNTMAFDYDFRNEFETFKIKVRNSKNIFACNFILNFEDRDSWLVFTVLPTYDGVDIIITKDKKVENSLFTLLMGLHKTNNLRPMWNILNNVIMKGSHEIYLKYGSLNKDEINSFLKDYNCSVKENIRSNKQTVRDIFVEDVLEFNLFR